MFQNWFKGLFKRGGLKTAAHESFGASFLLLDPSRVAEQLNIRSLAQENARRDYPPPDATAPDYVEESIKAHLRGVEADQGAIFSRRLKILKQALGNLTSDLDFHALNAQVQFVIQNAVAELQKGRAAIFSNRDRYVTLTNELTDFRRVNNLTRIEPRNQGNRTFKVGLIIFLLAVETVLNAGFFAGGTDQGFLGGGVIALAVSVINLGTAFFVGFKFFPMRNRADKLSKVVGYASLLVWILFVLLINLLAGHYREVINAIDLNAVSNPGILAVTAFLDSPFGLSDLVSWYLFAIGTLASALVFADGYTFDDPYPGFGDLWRRQKIITRILSDQIADQHEYLEEHFSELNSDLQQRLASLGGKRQRFENYRIQVAALHSEFQAFQKQLASVYSSVISQYRSENSSVRKSVPPEYFRGTPVFENSFFIIDDVDPEFLHDIQDAIADGSREIPALLKVIQKRRDEMVRQIPNFEEVHGGAKPQTVS